MTGEEEIEDQIRLEDEKIAAQETKVVILKTLPKEKLRLRVELVLLKRLQRNRAQLMSQLPSKNNSSRAESEQIPCI